MQSLGGQGGTHQCVDSLALDNKNRINTFTSKRLKQGGEAIGNKMWHMLWQGHASSATLFECRENCWPVAASLVTVKAR